MKQLFFILSMLSSFYTLSQVEAPHFKEIIKQFPNVRDIAISPNGNEIMFSAQNINGTSSTIISIQKEDNKFNKPKIASFSGQYFDLEPFFSHDGLKLYYASQRPLNTDSNKPKDFDIWYVERKDLKSEWSQPKNLGAPVNTEYDEFYPSISKNGNLYFTRDNPELKRKDDIYFSAFKEGIFSAPMPLPNAVNSVGYEYNAFIAPDESYLIYGCYNRKDGLGSGDLYISFKKEGNWTQAVNLGATINSNKMDYCPFIDKHHNLYFTSKKDNTSNKNNKQLSFDELKKELYQYSNGASRLYKVSFGNILNKLSKN